MSANEIIYRRIDISELKLNEHERAARLNVKRGYTDDFIEECNEELLKVLTPKFSAVRVPVLYGEEPETVDCGLGMIKTHSLTVNLKGSPEAFLFAATIGIGVDRLLARMKAVSMAKYFVTDGLASAYAEATAEYADSFLRQGLNCRPRFSPGYGDVPLQVQPVLLERVNAGKLLGISLGGSLLMAPMKSVTAIMGIQNET